MLRNILLGKLSISILASLLVGAICVSQPWRRDYDLTEAAWWIGVGVFFLLLGVLQIAAMVLMFWKKR